MNREWLRKLWIASVTGLVLTLLAGISGCAKNAEQNRLAGDGAEDIAPHSGNSNGLLYASGWSEITMVANYAKTTIDNVGHFVTSRNACGKDSYGVLELAHWNGLAKALNAAIKTPMGHTEICIARPEDAIRYMDGTTEVTVPAPRKLLFESRGSEICTNLADKQIAQELLTQLNKVVIRADREDCPNGWGS